MSDSLWPHGLQHARLPCPLPTPGVYSNSCPSSQWWILQVRIQEWVNIPFSKASFQCRNQTQVSRTAGGFFTSWATREAWLQASQGYQFSSVQSLSRVWLFATPWITAHQASLSQLPEFTQTHVHRVSDAIWPSHPLSSPSPPVLNPSQHQSLFQWVNSSHEVAKVLEFQPWHQYFQRTPRTSLL